jgi:hypothetical protein
MDGNNSAQYANLFGLILSIESVQAEFAKNTMTGEIRNRLFSQLCANFEAVCQALDLNHERVKEFAKACRLECGLCFEAIDQANALPSGLWTGVELGKTDFSRIGRELAQQQYGLGGCKHPNML